jgi:hypothetical protein
MCSVRFGGLSRSDFYEHKLTGRFVFVTLMPSVWAKGQLFPKQMMEKKKKKWV